MGLTYRAVQWNRQKRIYDTVLLSGVVAFLALFVGLGAALHPDATVETLLIRATATAALVLLHGILCIGPLCRLDPRFLPLLYNRRHLGVTMFALAAVHAALSTIQFHAFGDLNPILSIWVSNPHLDSVSEFPFQPFGAAALVVLFLMAATSHDFWLTNLSAPVWKALHMGVYVAYVLLIAHVVLGIFQTDIHPVFPVLLGVGMLLVVGLHVWSGLRERATDGARTPRGDDDLRDWVDAGPVAEIPENRARIVSAGGERVAVFRYDGVISALSNVCQHQNGPLGEGKVIDGCVTCPWHGYQYLPASGQSPPPFEERIPTFQTRIVAGRVWLDPRPLPAGTPVEPAPIPVESS